MEILFNILIKVGSDERNQDTKIFSWDYDVRKEDLEEFATHCGFENALEMLSCNFDPENDREEISNIEEDLEKDTFLCENYLDDHSKRLFQEFVAKKYQSKVESWLLTVLTHDSDKTLNDLIDYDF